MSRVRSSDGVSVAVHDLGSPSIRTVAEPPTVLIAHATGFHALCYTPIAAALSDQHRCFGFDARGHGATPVDPGWAVDWDGFGDDALAAARHVAPDGGLIGFGHSMGGAALLMAAHREPGLFDRLVLFEPISHQASVPMISEAEIRELPIVTGALRRRRRFESHDEAFENYRTKPPLALMVEESLRNYVDHGFGIVDDDGRGVDTGVNGGVELCCTPELEAEIFVTGRANGLWALLPEITTPTCVIGGHIEERQPSAQAEAIARHLADGEYVLVDHQTHLGPFSHPDEIAKLIAVGSPSPRDESGPASV